MNHSQIVSKLDAIERELKRIGFWDETLDCQSVRKQAVERAREQEVSPIANMSFENWLQAVFLPHARETVRTNSLPQSSHVGVMAMRQYDYHSHVPEAQPLLKLLYEFDQLISDR